MDLVMAGKHLTFMRVSENDVYRGYQVWANGCGLSGMVVQTPVDFTDCCHAHDAVRITH